MTVKVQRNFNCTYTHLVVRAIKERVIVLGNYTWAHGFIYFVDTVRPTEIVPKSGLPLLSIEYVIERV